MERFTKGPWFYEAATGDVHSNNYTDVICNMMPTGDKEFDANAALIAAAPEMYEMLKVAADELLFMIRKANSDLIQSVTSTTEMEPDYHDEQTVFDIMQLLKKARGEQ